MITFIAFISVLAFTVIIVGGVVTTNYLIVLSCDDSVDHAPSDKLINFNFKDKNISALEIFTYTILCYRTAAHFLNSYTITNSA